MKIAVPVDEKCPDTKVCVSFGRAPYFMLYDKESGEKVFLENEAADNPGGVGVKVAQFLVDNAVDVLLTPRCGENAAEILQVAEIALYKTQMETAMENINAFAENKLPLLSEIHPGMHGNGGK